MNTNKILAGRWDRKATEKTLRAVLFLIPALIFLPTIGGKIAFPLGENTYSDLLISHYPNLLYLRDSLFVHHQVPLWSSLIHSGAPFAANPLAGLFYLPGWTALILPGTAGMSLALAGHVIFGTWGMYRFLSLEGAGEVGSVLGALAFGLMPKLAAHFGAGHVSLIYAISWTPWLLSCSRTDGRGWITGLVAGMLFLADPRWSIYAGLTFFAYDIAHRQFNIKERAALYLKAVLIAVLIAAPLMLPMFEYISLTTRAELTSAELMQGSMPITQLAGMLVPGNGGNLEWYWYSGGSAIAVVAFTLFDKSIRSKNRFWLIIFCLGMILAFGNFGVEIGWINKIPLLNLARIPARSLFISGIALAILIGSSIDQITLNSRKEEKSRKVSFGIILFGMLMTVGLVIATGFVPWFSSWGFLFLAISGLVLFLLHGNKPRKQAAWIFVGILAVDFLGAGLASYQIREINPGDSNPILTFLSQEEGYFRIYSPSNSLPQDYAAAYHLEIADGIDPMQIAVYAEFMEDATGVERTGYSVTIPPFKTGNPSRDNQAAQLKGDLLGLLNVKYVVSEFEINSPDLVEISAPAESFLYLNEKAFPRTWIEDYEGRKIPLGVQAAAILSHTPNRIQIEAEGPGKLVLAEISYPGWRVYVNGVQAPVEEAHTILRSVSLADGKHTVLFVYQPISVYIGLLLAAAGWITLAGLKMGKKK